MFGINTKINALQAVLTDNLASIGAEFLKYRKRLKDVEDRQDAQGGLLYSQKNGELQLLRSLRDSLTAIQEHARQQAAEYDNRFTRIDREITYVRKLTAAKAGALESADKFLANEIRSLRIEAVEANRQVVNGTNAIMDALEIELRESDPIPMKVIDAVPAKLLAVPKGIDQLVVNTLAQEDEIVDAIFDNDDTVEVATRKTVRRTGPMTGKQRRKAAKSGR